jgi:hypothetical protein
VGLFFKSRNKGSGSWQRAVNIVDAEEQEEAVARLRVIGALQRGMLMGTPLVKTEQDRSIRIDDLAEVGMGGSRFRKTK